MPAGDFAAAATASTWHATSIAGYLAGFAAAASACHKIFTAGDLAVLAAADARRPILISGELAALAAANARRPILIAGDLAALAAANARRPICIVGSFVRMPPPPYLLILEIFWRGARAAAISMCADLVIFGGVA